VTGLIVPADNPEALAQAMTDILTDPVIAQKRAQAAREFAQKYCTLEVMGQKTEALIEKISSKNNKFKT